MRRVARKKGRRPRCRRRPEGSSHPTTPRPERRSPPRRHCGSPGKGSASAGCGGAPAPKEGPDYHCATSNCPRRPNRAVWAPQNGLPLQGWRPCHRLFSGASGSRAAKGPHLTAAARRPHAAASAKAQPPPQPLPQHLRPHRPPSAPSLPANAVVWQSTRRRGRSAAQADAHRRRRRGPRRGRSPSSTSRRDSGWEDRAGKRMGRQHLGRHVSDVLILPHHRHCHHGRHLFASTAPPASVHTAASSRTTGTRPAARPRWRPGAPARQRPLPKAVAPWRILARRPSEAAAPKAPASRGAV
mmetsp:Transcript_153733/g.492900  ORF Transcript_153733/g.492900 Transcript_153733/m.492900 type:complete len:299 (-) Transcript_153733:459-1355(-)